MKWVSTFLVLDNVVFNAKEQEMLEMKFWKNIITNWDSKTGRYAFRAGALSSDLLVSQIQIAIGETLCHTFQCFL